MGWIRDHAIIVIGTYEDHLAKAHAVATKIFGEQVTPITPAAINNSQAFLVAPDGGKEGWPESDTGDAKRSEFVAYLRSVAYGDGSSPLKWCEVIASDEAHELGILRNYADTWREAAAEGRH